MRYARFAENTVCSRLGMVASVTAQKGIPDIGRPFSGEKDNDCYKRREPA